MQRLRLLTFTSLAVLSSCAPPDSALRVNVTVRTAGTTRVRADCIRLTISSETQELKSLTIKRPADDTGVGEEAQTPEPIAEHDHAGRPRPIVVVDDGASDCGRHTERREIVAADAESEPLLRRGICPKADSLAAEARQREERVVPVLGVGEPRLRRQPPAEISEPGHRLAV